MAIVPPSTVQGEALLDGTQDFVDHDDAADNKAAGVYEHKAVEFSATEAESWCDFFRAVRDAISGAATSFATHIGLTTTAHGGVVASTDARLTDARTPTAHAASHETGGSDALTGFCKWRGVAATDPTSPVAGDIYKNSGDSLVYLYDGTAWVALT